MSTEGDEAEVEAYGALGAMPAPETVTLDLRSSKLVYDSKGEYLADASQRSHERTARTLRL
jgi:hypothetical protein